MSAKGSSFLRIRAPGEQRVTSIELFFDVVFVFAVTQLSHLLVEHLTVAGALQTLLLLLAVWWAWMDTAWVTNWLDPDRRATRAMLLGAMLASLIMASAADSGRARRCTDRFGNPGHDHRRRCGRH